MKQFATFTPGLVSALLLLLTFGVLRADAQDTTAPVLAFNFPTSGTTFTTTISSFEIKGTATDDVGVTQVTWTNNRGGSGTATGTTSWDSGINAIPLQLGANIVTFRAFDAAGNIGTKTLTVTRNAATPTTYYVATNGNNSNNGTSPATPFLTVQKGVNSAGDAPGNTLYIRGGTYREDVEENGNGNRGGEPGNYVYILAYPGETPILKGSQLVTGWVLDSGSVWKKTGWTTNSQQVFVDFDTGADKHPLQQIGSPPNSHTFGNAAADEFPNPNPAGMVRADMVSGTFFWDSPSNTLYVQLADNSDPNTHIMEASTTLRTFFLSGSRGYWYIKGLTFYHNNASASKPASPAGLPPGSMVNIDSNCILDSCNVQWSDFGGVGLPYLGVGAIVTKCTLSNNGNCGALVSASSTFTIQNCLITGNNYRGWNRLWCAGGMKFASGNVNGTVERNEVANNNGTGIWFDSCRSGNLITIRNNYVHNNGPTEAGIMFEISKNGQIYNNLLVENQRRGIYISASDDAKVYNNTIVRQIQLSAIEVNGMPRTGYTLTNNLIYNNIIYNDTATNSTYDLFMRKNEGTDVAGNTSDYNCTYRSTGAIQLDLLSNSTNVIKSDLPNWRTLTGWDTHSISANPAFVSGVGTDWTLSNASPAKDVGINLAEVATDYIGVVRPQGVTTDIGAFEFDVPPTLSPVSIASNNVNFSWAKLGDTVTVSFTASEPIQTPSVTLLGAAATAWNPSGNNWTATASVGAGTGEGTAAFSIAFSDLATNPGTPVSATTNASSVTVDKTAPAFTVLGANPATAVVDSTYSDAGATAADALSGSAAVTPSGTVNTAVPGSYTITYTAGDAAGNMGTATRTVTVPHTPHADWRVSAFGAQASNPALTGDLLDPNGNGVINLLEYALGGDPLGNTTGSSVLPVLGRDANNHQTLSFTRSLSGTDLTLTVQGADAVMGTWTNLAQSLTGGSFTMLQGGGAVVESGSGDVRAVTVSDLYQIGSSAHPQRFLRLQVTR